MDIQRGYIRLFRQFEDWEWYDNPLTKAIFIHCLLKANDRAKKWRDLTVKRGQFVTSYEKLAAANGMTIQQTRTVLKQLQSTNEIEYQSTNQYTLITIKNYNLYQASNIQKLNPDIIPTNKQNGGQVTTTNNSTINTSYINTHTIEKNVCVKNSNIEISQEDKKILRTYAKNNGAKNISAYVHQLIVNGGYLEILETEKKKITTPHEARLFKNSSWRTLLIRLSRKHIFSFENRRSGKASLHLLLYANAGICQDFFRRFPPNGGRWVVARE